MFKTRRENIAFILGQVSIVAVVLVGRYLF